MNPCDACTANKMIAGSQCTVVWHVDDLKVSHANPKVVDSFIQWIERNCGDPKLGKVKAKRGKVHELSVVSFCKEVSLRCLVSFEKAWEQDDAAGIRKMHCGNM